MNTTLAGFLYLIAAALFILGLKKLSSPATARAGNRLSAEGMLIAIVVTLLDRQVVSFRVILAGIVVGSGLGAYMAKKVQMTAMPQLVAAFNGFGGGASALVAASEFLGSDTHPTQTAVTIVLSALIGAVTFSGSFVAFGKLQGLISGGRVTYPGQAVLDGVLALGIVVLGVWLVAANSVPALWILLGASLLLGVVRVLPIGGADMPVVISFLNSLSGVAAATAGFVIESNALIISGALVGASGLILTNIMVKAMNRILIGVLFMAFGGTTSGEAADTGDKVVRRATPDDVAVTLAYAQRVVVVPGYGLAVAQAQHTIRELANLLEQRGVEVHYAIHPVAGRMPGHMNVLLAEADVPYDVLFELEDINPTFPRTDVALVVGANDVVNPSARTDTGSPIYGMPILDVDKARMVVVVKRSLSPGFAGIDNPLFYNENTLMLFADAKQGLSEVIASIKSL
ncbi:MAG: NAD(P)(+) transhydrogenase (Re/Si-specific) subunit beta [Acidimicrobiia bacterium]|nr:NAD(P)(+) transhydrogenase (Re/Si-specific) subunit beta [Acidimicrobiia bacterium]